MIKAYLKFCNRIVIMIDKQRYDASTGLYYLNARYYDPADKRFLTEDTYRGSENDPNKSFPFAAVLLTQRINLKAFSTLHFDVQVNNQV